jgi:hypothetical protein
MRTPPPCSKDLRKTEDEAKTRRVILSNLLFSASAEDNRSFLRAEFVELSCRDQRLSFSAINGPGLTVEGHPQHMIRFSEGR